MVMYIVLGVIAGLLLLTAAAGYFMFRFLLGRPKRSTKVPAYYEGSPHYIVSRQGMALMKTLPCEDVYIQSRDGLRLHAYLFPAPQGENKFVLGIHGYKSYARPEFGPYIAYYHSLGYSMLLPDDRAHAPSEGKYIGFGVLDRLDCVDWAKYLVNRFGEDTEILLHGVSMGAATVLAASGEADLPVQVTGVVEDCGYSRGADVLRFQLKHTAHLPVWPCLPLIEFFCRHLAGYGFSEHTPVEQVKKSRVPVLVVHGGRDGMVPSEMAQEIYDACPGKKKLFTVERAGHAECIALEPEGYHRAIEELFDLKSVSNT